MQNALGVIVVNGLTFGANMIPSWGMSGVIPPIRPGKEGNDSDRSPYQVSLNSVITRFSTSRERIEILEGLLKYRVELHKLGIINGIQWLDGSFMQDIESQTERSPSDIDVVTYFYLPEGETQETLLQKNPLLFNQLAVKAQYKVDAYFRELGKKCSELDVKVISYWYSMWSHCRESFEWKGYLQVTLDSNDTAKAIELLKSYVQGGLVI